MFGERFKEIPPEGEQPEGESRPNVSLREVAAEISESESDRGVINAIRKFVNGKVQESRLPTKDGLGYESTMGVYGGKLVKDERGRMVYDTRGFWSKLDQWGDRILRSFDEHHARRPGAMMLRHPKTFLKLLPFIVDSKRYRGTPLQTMENVRRFRLEEFYGSHPWGIEIKNPELFSRSIGLQDVFRQDLIGHPAIADIDRFEALGKAAEYMRALHETGGGIAEGNVYSFLFAEKNGGRAEKPFIMIPTEIYNPEKHIPALEQKATDVLDLLASAAVEEYRRSKDWDSVHRALAAALGSYGDSKVVAMARSYAKRGRLTLPGETEEAETVSRSYRMRNAVFAAHNTQRLSVKNPEVTARVRSEIVEACSRFLDQRKEDGGL